MSFASRLEDHMDEELILREGLASEGPKIVRKLLRQHSFRSLAGKVELSPTYLSQVNQRKVIISPGAYLKLVRFDNGRD